MGQQSNPDAGGVFTIPGVVPGKYRLDAALPALTSPVWVTRSVVWNGRDVTERLVDITGDGATNVVITLTDKITGLSGRVVDGQSRDVPGVWVLLIATDRTHWIFRGSKAAPRASQPGTDGRFNFTDILPGEYYLAASMDVDTAQLTSADYVEQFIPAAIKITVGEGEKKVQDLRVGGGSASSAPASPRR